MIRGFFLIVIIACISFSCFDRGVDSDLAKTREAEIIDSAIAYHGGTIYLHSIIDFSFRDRHYTVDRDGQAFKYTCNYTDSLGEHLRILDNTGYSEYLDKARVVLSAEDSIARAGSVNSVVYFTLLPSFLRDGAVSPKLEGIESIKNKNYYRIKVVFSEEDGGLDFEDVYYYWFDTEDKSMDYLAYSFKVNGGGTRFREAVNPRKINGILFQDYLNYKGPQDPDSIGFISDLYKAGKIPFLSEIGINRIAVIEKDAGIVAMSK